jgi:hypothetical protein
MWASVLLKDSFTALGVDLNRAFELGFKSQMEIMGQVGRFEQQTRGVYDPGGVFKGLHERTIRFFFPKAGTVPPRWLRAAHSVLDRVAAGGARVMEWAA